MRVLMMVAALAAVSACNRGGTANNSTANQADEATAAAPDADAAPADSSNTAAATTAAVANFPEGFPSDDAISNGATCYNYLMIGIDASDANTGFDGPAMEQAANQWRAQLLQGLTETEVRQLTASDTNFRLQTPAPQRNAAARWCVENAPEIDPEG